MYIYNIYIYVYIYGDKIAYLTYCIQFNVIIIMITVVTIIIKRKQFRRISSSQNQNMT